MLLESLGRIVSLGDTIFCYEDGYQFPVAEIDDIRAATILKGEAQKIARGIPPAIRKATPYVVPEKKAPVPEKPVRKKQGRPAKKAIKRKVKVVQ